MVPPLHMTRPPFAGLGAHANLYTCYLESRWVIVYAGSRVDGNALGVRKVDGFGDGQRARIWTVSALYSCVGNQVAPVRQCEIERGFGRACVYDCTLGTRVDGNALPRYTKRP
jgi:hypothetical protein